MKKLFVFITLMFMLTGCASETPESIKMELQKLKPQVEALRLQKDALSNERYRLQVSVKKLEENKSYLKHIAEGESVKYIFTLELKQSHFTLDLGEHIKDSMNTCKFEIAVDKETYDSQEVDQELIRKFRKGSFLLNGSYGDWVVTVIDKRIKYFSTR